MRNSVRLGWMVGRLISSLPSRIGRPATRTPYIPQIDGLRFIAITIVLIWHISLRASRFADQINGEGGNVTNLYGWFPHGETGVALFFFISGYVIAQPFLSRPRGQWRIDKFYLQRFRRIYPPYFIAVTVCLLIVAASGFRSASELHAAGSGPLTIASWGASVLYLHWLLYDTSSRLNPPIWSLEIEIQFYILAPLLLAIYRVQSRPALRIAVGWLFVALLIIAASLVDLVHPFDGRFRFGLVAHIYLFVAGVVMADTVRIYEAFFKKVSIGFDAVFMGGLSLLGAVGLYLTQVDTKPGGGWADIACNGIMLLAVLAIFSGAMMGQVSRRFMGSPWIALIGTMCFSIYLVHVIVIEAVARLLRRVPLHNAAAIWVSYIVVLVPASLLIGCLYYLVVERPFMTGLPLKTLPSVAGRVARLGFSCRSWVDNRRRS